MLQRWPYRVRQFARSVGARPTPAGLALARGHLTEAELRLFCANAPRDQWHHIRTLELLPPALRADREVARAALLHDTGKGHIRLHERVVYVLLQAAAPRLLARLARCDGAGLPGALYRIRHHARLGVEELRPLGASARELELIARHHDRAPSDPVLAALIRADDLA